MDGTPTYRPGSEEDFDRLYRDSYAHVLRTLVGVLRDRPSAEECVQETFVRALRAWPRWRPDAPAEAWIHRIAINVAASHRRREGLRILGERLLALARTPAPETADPARSTELLDALRRLPVDQAAAIVLRHVHGYTNREIASALGVAESTIASRLASAKARLRVDLDGRDGAILAPSR
jgi:RNA polymerase sigma-70 factor (ECF subfamily)